MIPIKVSHRLTRVPAVSALLLASCVAVFIRLNTMPPTGAESLLRALAVIPSRLLDSPVGFARDSLTLLTASFLHAGWVHLLGNMLYLGVFGPAAEDSLGSVRFSAVYFASGTVGLLAQSLADPLSTIPIVGASASIGGILGAYLVLLPRSKVTTVIPVFFAIEIAMLPAGFLVAVWFLLQVAGAAASEGGAGTAWIAHIGGFLMGVTGALVFRAAAGNKKRRP